ncbi:MAG: carboxypeptidase-like regulatory domain-containing protein [bacterium]
MHNPLIGALAGALLLGSVCAGAPVLDLSGSITGVVANSAGVPQMGATVLLYNRFDRLVEKSLTAEDGTFSFKSLVPGTYAIRISMASFLPALKRNIVVQPGMQSLLSVNLTSVFSSIELVGLAPGRQPIMSDEWKWVLRSSSATRPVLRYAPELDLDKETKRSASMFSGTHGVVKVSAGDQPHTSALGSAPDLGTAFALATSFLGKNKLEVSGNVGYGANSGAPTAAIRTSFRREELGGSAPEVQVTMRQVFMPARADASLLSGMERNAPLLRSISAQVMNEVQLASNMRLEYGSSVDTVSFIETLNYFSPYARLTVTGEDDTLQVAYSSGLPPVEMFIEEGGTDAQNDLTGLALFPRMSIAGGRARVQRVQSLEAGYRKRIGSRTYAVGVHFGNVSNAAVTVAGADGMTAPELLPDLFARTHVLNAGNYHTQGYIVAVTQSLGRNLDATVSWSTGDALTAEAVEKVLLNELRQALESERRHSLTARVTGSLPASGTQFAASYQWANINAVTPPHAYMTQNVREGVGLNIRVRQALPPTPLFPGRVEATADLQNLLDQGYVPILCEGGRRLVLMHTPRTMRGGVSFIF